MLSESVVLGLTADVNVNAVAFSGSGDTAVLWHCFQHICGSRLFAGQEHVAIVLALYDSYMHAGGYVR